MFNELGDAESIEVNKSNNYADIFAYLFDSLDGIKRFCYLDAEHASINKSDGMLTCKYQP